MDEPHCRICGSSHWPRDPHKWKAETVAMADLRKSSLRREVAKRLAVPLPESSGRTSGVLCACGCGVSIPVKPRYATAACRQRASRKRRAK